ncbi:MAG: hypothetical protein QW046_05075 [Candidatus Micrarchaeaceae archaeon]
MESGEDKLQEHLESLSEESKLHVTEYIKNVVEQNIKALRELQHAYELEWDVTEYLSNEIFKNTNISKPIRGELIDVLDVIQNYLHDVVEVHSKALDKAYNAKNNKNVLDSLIALYLDLRVVNVMLNLMNEYMQIPTFIFSIFKDLTDKTKNTITLLTYLHIQDKVTNEVKGEIAKYYELVEKGKESFVKDLNELDRMAKNKEDMTKEAYIVLLGVSNLMQKYYDDAITFAKDAFNADKASVALNELVEAYAGFSAINALYFMYCEYWDVCTEHLENSLHEIFTRTQQVIDKIIT